MKTTHTLPASQIIKVSLLQFTFNITMLIQNILTKRIWVFQNDLQQSFISISMAVFKEKRSSDTILKIIFTRFRYFREYLNVLIVSDVLIN